MKNLGRFQIAARILVTISVPWLVVLAANFGLRLAALAFGDPLPTWKLYVDTTWLVTRYWACFCMTIWLIGYVMSWLSTGGFQEGQTTGQNDSKLERPCKFH